MLIPSVLLDSPRYEISGREGHKGPSHHRATARNGKTYPLENFPKVVRTRDVVKQPVANGDGVAYFFRCRLVMAQAPQGGISLGIDRHTAEGQGQATYKGGVSPPVLGKTLEYQ